MPKTGQRRDSKHRILHTGESTRATGKYQFKYIVNGKPKFLYSWRLTPTDPLPAGKQPCLSLRELEAEIGRDMASRLDPACSNMTVSELVARYLKTKKVSEAPPVRGTSTSPIFLPRKNSAPEIFML